MTEFPCCPNCYSKPSGGLFGGSHFYVQQCDRCGMKYCHRCSGSNGGRECPNCGCSDYRNIAIVYA
jgi:hypothetical protein